LITLAQKWWSNVEAADGKEARLGWGGLFESRHQDLLVTLELNRIPSQVVSFF